MMDTLSAYHEAGHATVSLLLGEMPDSASIAVEELPEGVSEGHTRYLGVEARAIAEAAVLGRTKVDRERVTRYLIATAAGPAAQALYMRRGSRASLFDQTSWDIFGGSMDYQQAERVLEKARGLLYVDLNDVVNEACSLLEQPEIWSSVERVAGDLVRFGELDYEGIRDAVMFNDLIGIKPKRSSRHDDELRRDGWAEGEIGTGRRVLSREEAARKIKAKSPFGWGRVGWNKEMERR
jgi:hypothetical protein